MAEKEWTIMIYMAGDNNLSADMSYSVARIKEAAKVNDKVNIFVYFDGVADAPTYYIDCSSDDNQKSKHYVAANVEHDKKLRSLLQPSSASTAIEPTLNESSASVDSLLRFVDWCLNDTESSVKDKDGKTITIKHKGKRTTNNALILSGHSSAFRDISLMADIKSGKSMTIPDLTIALEKITKPEDGLLQKKFDILGFDSCMMGMLELGYQFKPFAERMIASEGNLPNAGWSYGSILSDLSKQTNLDSIAQSIVEDFINTENEYLMGGVNVDLSAWDLSKVSIVTEKLHTLAELLNDNLDNEDLKRAILFSHWECQGYLFEQNIDLKDFCRSLQKGVTRFDKDDKSGIIKACDEIAKSVYDCIIMCGFSGSKYQHSNGISLFFPWNKISLDVSKNNYSELNFNKTLKEKGWNYFLNTFLTKTTLRGERELLDGIPAPGDYIAKPGEVLPTKIETKTDGAVDLRHYTFTATETDLVSSKVTIIPQQAASPMTVQTEDDSTGRTAEITDADKNDPNNPKIKGFDGVIQFKNFEARWDISGFTKPTSKMPKPPNPTGLDNM
jgi:Clostripain family